MTNNEDVFIERRESSDDLKSCFPHFPEIHELNCGNAVYILCNILKIKMAWSLTKLWHSDQRFIKNILTPLLLKICLKYLRMCILQLLFNMLFTSFWIWQQLNTPALWILMNIWVYRWCHECVYMTFSCKYVLVCNFLLEMLTSIHAMLLSSMGNLSNVSIKLKFRRNKFGRRTVCTE